MVRNSVFFRSPGILFFFSRPISVDLKMALCNTKQLILVQIAIAVTFSLFVRFCAATDAIEGPFEFYIRENTGAARFLDKVGDKCVEMPEIIGGAYFIGATNYDSILVCENGYLLPHFDGESLPGKWEDGNSFDSPTDDILAVALLNNTLRDNWYDYGCVANYDNNAYTLEEACDVYNRARGISDTAASEDFYYIQPAYGDNAVRSNFIKDWKDAGLNSLSYYAIYLTDLKTYGESIRQSTFSQTPGESFAPLSVNNVMARILIASEYPKVTSIAAGLSVTWAACVSWYKVSQPPEIVDKQNSFQFVLACGEQSGVARCVTLFDYFELMYIENGGDGNYLRAGLNGPSIGQ